MGSPLRLRIRLSAAPCLALALLLPTPAHAQSDSDRATARALGNDGQQALESKDYKTAEDRFRRADSLVHAPTLMLGLARGLAGQGKFVEAQETYNRIIRDGLPPNASETFKRALADAKKEVEGVSPKIGGTTISVHAAGGGDVPNAKVVLDGSPVNSASLGVRRSIDPGSHVLQVSADGFKPAELRFDVVEGGSVDEPVLLEVDRNAPGPAGAPGNPGPAPGPEQPVAAPASSGGGGARAALPWVAFGIGGAGLVVGAVTGFIAMGKHSDLATKCPGGTCDSTQYPGISGDVDSYHTVATISTVGFIVGGVGVAAGVVLLLTQPKTESVPPAQPPQAGLRVVPVVGLGSIGAAGQF
jgi:hypothetical protein